MFKFVLPRLGLALSDAFLVVGFNAGSGVFVFCSTFASDMLDIYKIKYVQLQARRCRIHVCMYSTCHSIIIIYRSKKKNSNVDDKDNNNVVVVLWMMLKN